MKNEHLNSEVDFIIKEVVLGNENDFEMKF
jgi:hypothetical protein